MRERVYEFIRFCIVGSVAVGVDAAVFFALVTIGITDRHARIFSIAVGMHVAYVLSAHYTYRNHAGISWASWRAFIISNIIGIVINYAVFLGALAHSPFDNLQHTRLFAIACGTAVPLFFNYWANRRFAFRKEAP